VVKKKKIEAEVMMGIHDGRGCGSGCGGAGGGGCGSGCGSAGGGGCGSGCGCGAGAEKNTFIKNKF
jgi:hypothetical protein